MRTSHHFRTWEALERRLIKLDYEATKRGHSRLLYRGHADHKWRLETTLERKGIGSQALLDYYEKVAEAKTRIETFTGKTWPEIDCSKIDQQFSSNDALRGEPPAYELLVYLRHHGFPSPLLDWTLSPYIAAYFACQNVPENATRVAIWVYEEPSGVDRLNCTNAPHIKLLGPNVKSDQRHFLQQGQYTLAVHYSECPEYPEKHWRLTPHEDAFAKGEHTLTQLTLPRTQVNNVMAKLDRMNINTYSLFQTEDALLETTWRKLQTK